MIEVTPKPRPSSFVAVIGSRKTRKDSIADNITPKPEIGKIILPCPPIRKACRIAKTDITAIRPVNDARPAIPGAKRKGCLCTTCMTIVQNKKEPDCTAIQLSVETCLTVAICHRNPIAPLVIRATRASNMGVFMLSPLLEGVFWHNWVTYTTSRNGPCRCRNTHATLTQTLLWQRRAEADSIRPTAISVALYCCLENGGGI